MLLRDLAAVLDPIDPEPHPIPLHSVGLRKLHWSIGFDIEARYRQLQTLHERLGFADEVQWLQWRLEHVTST